MKLSSFADPKLRTSIQLCVLLHRLNSSLVTDSIVSEILSLSDPQLRINKIIEYARKLGVPEHKVRNNIKYQISKIKYQILN